MGIVIATHLPPPVTEPRTLQHELGFEDRPNPFDDAVEGRRHPRNGRMLHQALDISDGSAGVAKIVSSVNSILRLSTEIESEPLQVG